MALPAIADVRRAWPSARITVAARRSVADLFALAPMIDAVVRLESGGSWWRRRGPRRDAAVLKAAGADAALILPNSFASALLVTRAGIPQRWGYRSDWRGRLLTRGVMRARASVHQGAYYQALTRALGIASGPLEPELSVTTAAQAAARALLSSAGWDGASPLVVFAPGAAYGTAKRWLPEYVAQVATALASERGAACALIGSRADSVTTTQIVRQTAASARPRVMDLAGQTSLEQMAAVLSLARVCVSNDSGAMHVAAALGTPVVAIFGPTREYETAPLTRAGGTSDVLLNPVWCRPCMLRECPIDHRCMTGIPPARVRQAVERHL
jgi:heptosyltransferase-2